MVAWWQRHQTLYPRDVLFRGLAAHGEDRLRELAQKYGARYVVMDRYLAHRPLLWHRVYPDPFDDPEAIYEVYEVPGTRPRNKSP